MTYLRTPKMDAPDENLGRMAQHFERLDAAPREPLPHGAGIVFVMLLALAFWLGVGITLLISKAIATASLDYATACNLGAACAGGW